MKISVIGCGRWGSFIGWYLDRIGHKVSFFGKEESKSFQGLRETHTNGILTLSDRVAFTSCLPAALSAEAVVLSVPSQSLRSLLREIRETGANPDKTIFILCMKGIEIESGKRLSEVFEEEMGTGTDLAVWLGPGHPQEFVKNVPNCMVIDSKKEEVKRRLIEEFKGSLIRFYYGSDLVGNEIGGAAKNVIGIAAGVLDGIGKSSLKGALMSRGTHEIAKLIEACGGNPFSAYGLCHLGDYEATVFSPHSHNRMFGEMFARGERFDKLAEGYFTAKAIVSLAQRKKVELPICSAVYKMLYENMSIEEGLEALFSRSLKQEF